MAGIYGRNRRRLEAWALRRVCTGAIANTSGRKAIEAYAVEAVLTGRAQPLRGAEMSAIAKVRRAGAVAVTHLGLEGDEQADRVHHGGPDMAVHHYPRDHYEFWRSRLSEQGLLAEPGALGENISTSGLAEAAACIGDRYRLGSAVVEISQGRQPCWKPGHRLGDNAVAGEIVRTGFSGWYYRVIEPGVVSEGDALALLDRPEPAWTVAKVFGLLVANRQKAEPKLLRDLGQLAPLSAHWRSRALAMAAQ